MHALGPGTRSGPRRRIRFDGVGAAREKKLHQLDAPPPACPSERGALEKVVANVEAGSGIQQNCGELDTHAVIARNGLMQHGLAIVGGAVMRPTAGQDQLKAFATLGLLLSVVVFVAGHRSP